MVQEESEFTHIKVVIWKIHFVQFDYNISDVIDNTRIQV
jgi:hypothetical protein